VIVADAPQSTISIPEAPSGHFSELAIQANSVLSCPKNTSFEFSGITVTSFFLV
jgi:hypothetical protein